MVVARDGGAGAEGRFQGGVRASRSREQAHECGLDGGTPARFFPLSMGLRKGPRALLPPVAEATNDLAAEGTASGERRALRASCPAGRDKSAEPLSALICVTHSSA